MGLDMYLYARKAIPATADGYPQLLARTAEEDGYISWYNHDPDALAPTLVAATGFALNDRSPHGHVTFADGVLFADVCIAYWRKANAIHAWFVAHVAGGEDDCEPVEVTREQLAELRAACTAVLLNPDTAADTLPTQSGFFFGGIEYGKHYLDDLRDTVKQLDEALALGSDVSFIYRASW